MGEWVGGVGREGRRKRVAWWSGGGSEEMGGQFSVEMDFPYPPIGSLFPCLGRKKLTWRKSISAENCRTKHMKKKFSVENYNLFRGNGLHKHALSVGSKGFSLIL